LGGLSDGNGYVTPGVVIIMMGVDKLIERVEGIAMGRESGVGRGAGRGAEG
jgi:hypothetical protein